MSGRGAIQINLKRRSARPTRAASPSSESEATKSRSRSPPRGTPGATGAAAVLGTAALEDIFSRFHGELDAWLQSEAAKLEATEAKGAKAKATLTACASKVCGFLKDHAPAAYEELGPDAEGDAFVSRALPQFLATLEDDRRVLQEAAASLAAFVDERFPKNDRLRALKSDSSPLPLLRALLQQMPPR